MADPAADASSLVSSPAAPSLGHGSKRSARVILTVAAAVSMAAHAQQSGDPCEPATFSGKSCQSAVHHGGFCSGGSWVPMTYDQRYPYYYDRYLTHIAAGGAVIAAPEEKCKRPSHFLAGHGVARRGFGGIGAGRVAGG